MSKQQGRRIDRHTAEQLLRGAPADAPDALAGLLAAAAAPPRDGELGGEPAAMTAFREAAQHARSPLRRSPSMIKTRWAKLLTVKVAAAAAAVFTVGGVAAAAVTGALPFQAGHAPSPAPAASSHAQPPAGDWATETTKTHAPDGTRPADQPSPSPSLVGLCHAYSAGDKTEHGKALESPAFTALITAAGDKAKVDGYCDALLKDEAAKPAHPTGAPADPGNSDNGKDHPTPAHPAGAPATHPSGPPATRPNR
ncbi:hypothetical protein [Amycolatopsis sp. MtRt-6]|uniref:hypothetical protein n=1 Tax=Amycolatopsis sp. MtRt-6 TaxID=2792782 RepID=UPI001A8D6877|nr:hypothetical protein [Amycolatopsis sp. MtRt-6]